MPETFEKLNKEEIKQQIEKFESDLMYGSDTQENERAYKKLLEKSDPEKHKMSIERAKRKLAEIEEIKKLRIRLLEILSEESDKTKKPKEKIIEVNKTESYPTKTIEDVINQLLSKIPEIKEIKNLEVKGINNELELNLSLKVKKVLTSEVTINLIIENENGKIKAKKGYSIKATKFEDLIKGKLEPSLKDISEYIEKYIKDQNKEWEIKGMQIENGELKVNFSKNEKGLEEEKEETEPQEKKSEEFSDFYTDRDDGILDQLYETYKKITEDSSKLKTEKENAEKQMGYIEAEIKRRIKIDFEKNKFLYYALEKNNNQYLSETKKTLTDKRLNIFDLRKYSNSPELEYSILRVTSENEGFFEFNIFGFIKIIKNVNEIKSKDGIELFSQEAIYKIVGPNNEIIADNIKGYDKTQKIYEQKIDEYIKSIQPEFLESNY